MVAIVHIGSSRWHYFVNDLVGSAANGKYTFGVITVFRVSLKEYVKTILATENTEPFEKKLKSSVGSVALYI